MIAEQDTITVVPYNCPRSEAIPYDLERHLVECGIDKIKHVRRIFASYDKTATAFFFILYLCVAMI